MELEFQNKRHDMLLNAPVRWWKPWKMMDAKRFAHLCVWSVMELCRSDETSKKLWHSWIGLDAIGNFGGYLLIYMCARV